MSCYAVITLLDGRTSWRAVASSDDILPGETFATEPPTPTFAEVKLDLCAQVDASADAAYFDFGGRSLGRLAEY
jgi:hypothetical protein